MKFKSFVEAFSEPFMLDLMRKAFDAESGSPEQKELIKKLNAYRVKYGMDPVDEAMSRPQQAAIAIAKKKSGKYDEDGKRIKESLQEFDTVRAIKHMLATTVSKDRYQKALAVLKGVIARKEKEARGSSLNHDIEYYAQEIGKQFRGIDARELAKLYRKEESIKEDQPYDYGTDASVKYIKKMTPGEKK